VSQFYTIEHPRAKQGKNLFEIEITFFLAAPSVRSGAMSIKMQMAAKQRRTDPKKASHSKIIIFKKCGNKTL
jgi:hypothetical protein